MLAPTSMRGRAAMKIRLAASLLLLLVACARPSDAPVPPDTSRSPATTKAPVAATPSQHTSTSLVVAEALPGRRLRISIGAREQALSIVNCNQHVVVALLEPDSHIPVWGGASDACLSQNIIVPAGATLSFELLIDDTALQANPSTSYRAQVFNVLQGSDPKGPPVPAAQLTSNLFRLLP
jgi:hypothetical protein